MEDPTSPAEPEEVRLPAGTRLGKYEVIRLLGAGGMGAVYEGVHTEIGKRVAIKTLSPAVSEIPGARARFVREAQLTSRVRHPHIVDVSDVGTDGGRAYIVMELLRGEDLSQRLARTGAMAPRELADVMLPVCSALVAAHDATIVHRDLKPQNIFLATGPHGVQPKVLDFGISKSSDALTAAGALTRTGSVMGTPYYLAPEQIQDARAAGPSSDQYALGVILYECLAGQRPFEGESLFSVFSAIVSTRPTPLRQRRAELPQALCAIVERAMSAAQAARFPSVRDLGRALLPFAGPKTQMIWEEAFSGGGGPGETLPAPLPSPVLMTPTPPPVFATPAPRTPTAPTLQGVPRQESVPPQPMTGELEPGSLRPSRRPLVIGAVLAIVMIGAVAALALRPPPTPPVVEAPLPEPKGVAAPVAAAAPAPPAPPPAAPKAETPEVKVEVKVAAPEPPARVPAPKRRHVPEARHKAPAAPPAAPERARNLNPNGAPVID